MLSIQRLQIRKMANAQSKRQKPFCCRGPESVLSSWIYGSNCCRRRGDRCDKLAGEIVRVDLSDGSWKGTVDMVNFSEVKALMHLDLTYNSFGGVIPDTNGSLVRLTLRLNLASCGFSGVISESQLEAPSLLPLLISPPLLLFTFLAISCHCGIPPSLARLSSFTYLGLSNNELNESIPITCVSRLCHLQALYLFSNRSIDCPHSSKLDSTHPASSLGFEYLQLLASGSIESWQVEWRATNGDINISTSGAVDRDQNSSGNRKAQRFDNTEPPTEAPDWGLFGRIPPVRHLNTFGTDSYVGNPNLCGPLLHKIGQLWLLRRQLRTNVKMRRKKIGRVKWRGMEGYC
eukprot:Gb_05192 [translate_table: standard]